jgi:endoglucanase
MGFRPSRESASKLPQTSARNRFRWDRSSGCQHGLAIIFLILVLPVVCRAADTANVSAINHLIGRGINIGNALEAPVEGAWGVTIKDEYFDVIKTAGFNSVRLAVCWPVHAGREAPYRIEGSFFQRIDEVIRQANRRDLVVLLTMHHYNELYQDPTGHTARFLALWRQIAERYRDYSPKLLFEPLNEPHDHLGTAAWNQLLREVLVVIRSSNPTRAVVLGPGNYNDIQQLAALELPQNDRHLIVSVHYYLPYHFTHQGSHWAAGSKAWLGTQWTGSGAEKQAIRDHFEAAGAWARKHGRPVCLSEFGANSKADLASRVRWTKYVADTALSQGFSLTYWDFCAEYFGLYDPGTKSWRRQLLEAVVPPEGRSSAGNN